MSGEGLARVQGVEGAPYRTERAAAEALQRGVQELRRHVVKEPLHGQRCLWVGGQVSERKGMGIAQPWGSFLVQVGCLERLAVWGRFFLV